MIDRILDRQVALQKRVLVRNLAYIGEQVVNKARSLPTPSLSIFWDTERGEPMRNIPKHTPNYIDWTANLRSSIGYIVVMDGMVVTMSDFTPVRGREDNGTTGSSSGIKYARELSARFPSGVALIVVAGMNYAKYVQRRGYDVTLSAEHLANQLLRDLGMPNTKTV